MSNIKNRKESGFTIIEVLIVLAIAGLIMLIVFLAVPALQRNSRNTQRKNDVSAVLTAVNEYANNNQGKLPTNATEFTSALDNANLGYYEKSAVTFGTSNTNGATGETIQIKTSASCSGDNAATAASRRFVALYAVETSSSTDKICQEG